jgi:hypothetical protein
LGRNKTYSALLIIFPSAKAKTFLKSDAREACSNPASTHRTLKKRLSMTREDFTQFPP